MELQWALFVVTRWNKRLYRTLREHENKSTTTTKNDEDDDQQTIIANDNGLTISIQSIHQDLILSSVKRIDKTMLLLQSW